VRLQVTPQDNGQDAIGHGDRVGGPVHDDLITREVLTLEFHAQDNAVLDWRVAPGFARSHRSAQQALRHALLTGAAAASYDDIALDALCHVDLQQADDFALHALAPLVVARNADVLYGTLAAWTAAGLRAEDAASALGVSTRTVLNRLASAGELLGHHPRELATELDIALRIRAHTQTRQAGWAPRLASVAALVVRLEGAT